MSAERDDSHVLAALLSEAVPEGSLARSRHVTIDAIERRIAAIERPRLHIAEWVVIGLFVGICLLLAPIVIARVAAAVDRILAVG